MNRMVLQAQVVQRGSKRYTPAGLPALDLSLKHESQVTEAGLSRKVSLEIRAVGIGIVAEQLSNLAVGRTAGFAGFLGSARNGRGVLFHVTEVQASEIAQEIAHDIAHDIAQESTPGESAASIPIQD